MSSSKWKLGVLLLAFVSGTVVAVAVPVVGLSMLEVRDLP